MSEELQSKYTKKRKIVGQKFGEFEYFQIGSTTFKQLKQAKLISTGFDTKFNSHKPDRIIVDRREKIPSVIAIVEDKVKGKFASEIDLLSAVRQCNTYCQEISAPIGIITDGSTTVWINPNHPNNVTEYMCEVTKEKRSYTIIKNEDESDIKTDFKIEDKSDFSDPEKMPDEVRKVYKLIIEIKGKISSVNSIIKQPDKIDPLPLATRVWQDIWVATRKSPEKCLYNVVELFIFKFLSDLKLLTEPDNFEYLYSLIDKKSNKDILDHYAKVCRPKIRTLFPPNAEDGTTIINGTIFVNEDGEANTSQSYLFVNSLRKFKQFEEEQGTFECIDKDFKTKIFETFLKQSEGQKALGQYFTPRKVVQAVVKMSGIETLKKGARFCDPFCGVGGFVLEPINLYRLNDFEPKEGKIEPPINYLGYDKGFEKDDERTIILAKANMLIYLTELISKHPTPKLFADVFNNVFKLWPSNLGTLEQIFDSEEDKFDLIMTNPPYVTSGSSSIKKEIAEDADLNSFYSINSAGVEGLALEWIIRNLKKGGKAFIIIPDGILNRLNDKKMRKFILDSCYLEGIISLPAKTFFSTPKKTYILAITKKEKQEDEQNFPVFTYLVSNIGETLDSKRFEIKENDLDEAVKLFRIFLVNKQNDDITKDFEVHKRCKIFDLKEFDPKKHWSVDRWWTKEEKIDLGIEEEEEVISADDFFDLVKNTAKELNDIIKKRSRIVKKKIQPDKIKFTTISLSDETYFNLAIGKRLLKKDLFNNTSNKNAIIPAYSANVFEPFGYIEKSNLTKFDNPYVLWGIDGNFDFVIKPVGEKFATTDHCDTIEIIEKSISPEYLLSELYVKKIIYGFDRGLRSNLVNVRGIDVDIPIDSKGKFDTKLQKLLVERNRRIKDIQDTIQQFQTKIETANVEIENNSKSKDFRIEDLFILPSIKGLTASFIQNNKGDIPVYGGRKEAIPIGHIKDGLKGVKYFENCLAWNREGSVGYVFWHKYKFTTNDHHRPILIKDDYKEVLDPLFIKYALQKMLLSQGFQWSKTAGKTKVGNLTINIPVMKDNTPDLVAQKDIASRYKEIASAKNEAVSQLNLITHSLISFD